MHGGVKVQKSEVQTVESITPWSCDHPQTIDITRMVPLNLKRVMGKLSPRTNDVTADRQSHAVGLGDAPPS